MNFSQCPRSQRPGRSSALGLALGPGSGSSRSCGHTVSGQQREPGLRAWVAGDCEAERRLQAQPVPGTGASKPRRPACLPSRAAIVAEVQLPGR